jgi:hypothetical protein
MARKIKRYRPVGKAAETLRHLRAIAGLERAEFFANGGDLKQWRPPKKVAVDKRRRANKQQCRGAVKI